MSYASVPCLQTCYHNVVVLDLLKLFQHSILSCWFPIIHESYVYDAMILFDLCYVYFDAMPLVAMFTCCSLSLSCSQVAIIVTLLMHMLLCYKVAYCIDHIGLILMPMNLKFNDIWSMLSVHEVHVKFVFICFLWLVVLMIAKWLLAVLGRLLL